MNGTGFASTLRAVLNARGRSNCPRDSERRTLHNKHTNTTVKNEKEVEILQCLFPAFVFSFLDISQMEAASHMRGIGIIVKLKYSGCGSDRDSLHKMETKLRGSRLFIIAESLTPRRQEMLRQLIRLKKDGSVHAAFTQAGEIFARQTFVCPVSVGGKITDRQFRGPVNVSEKTAPQTGERGQLR